MPSPFFAGNTRPNMRTTHTTQGDTEMKDKIKSALVTAKEHVKENKFGYSMLVVALGAITLQQTNKNAFYHFLEEKGIDPMEYYNPEFYTELKSK